MKVSFIIPSYNSLRTLPLTIESLLRQPGNDFEIIVVDSSDDEMARKYIGLLPSERVKIIQQEKKTIPAEGRNIGAHAAKGELLCFIDSDVILSDDWLENIRTAYQEGCKTGGGAISIPESQKENVIALAQMYLQFNEYLNAPGRQERLFVPSCNMFCDKNLFWEAGGFPGVRASEDTLFFLRLQGQAKVYFIPEAKCYHMFREGWKEFLGNQFLLGQYVSIYRREFYQSWIYKGIIPLVLTPAFLIVKFFRIVSRVAKVAGEHAGPFVRASPVFLIGFFWWSAGFIKGFVNDGNTRS